MTKKFRYLALIAILALAIAISVLTTHTLTAASTGKRMYTYTTYVQSLKQHPPACNLAQNGYCAETHKNPTLEQINLWESWLIFDGCQHGSQDNCNEENN
jgi:hypothetical protein